MILTTHFTPLALALIQVSSWFFQSYAFAAPQTANLKRNALRNAYYGDLHVHTNYSADAYLSRTSSVGPNEAYRFAKGEVVDYLGEPARRREPLDFLAITDHSEGLGIYPELEDQNSLISRSVVGSEWKAAQEALPSNSDPLMKFIHKYVISFKNNLPDSLKSEEKSAWARYVQFANDNYDPGKFTTFIAYEWSPSPNGANLHRNIIFKGAAAPSPFTSWDSNRPEDLWTWLETIRKQGFEALAIPHNANASNGLMYGWLGTSQLPMSQEHARTRQENEPLGEIAQNKGTSETHPLLSPNDEFSDYEIFDFIARRRRQESPPQGSYLRDALSRGLVLQRELGVNPYKIGFVGGSDFHSGLSSSSQMDFGGNDSRSSLGGGRPTSDQARLVLGDAERSLHLTSGSLTGVWAENNTRESIYDALRRRETFATSGTRIKFRFFGGWNFDDQLLDDPNWIEEAYRGGVPMGSDLPSKPTSATAPMFVAWALKDPNGASLDRLQVIKVWEVDGQQKEKIFNIAWSGDREIDTQTGLLPTVGNTVDLKTGRFTNDIGSVKLTTVWRDPEFRPNHLAAYYLRVLEVPTPRWSTLLAIHNGLQLPPEVPPTTQQRGWSSPIWYTPRDTSNGR